jgi:hypothetical protein
MTTKEAIKDESLSTSKKGVLIFVLTVAAVVAAWFIMKKIKK